MAGCSSLMKGERYTLRYPTHILTVATAPPAYPVSAHSQACNKINTIHPEGGMTVMAIHPIAVQVFHSKV